MTSEKMRSTGYYIWNAVRFGLRPYLFYNIIYGIDTLMGLIPGLVSREFFNLLTANSPAGFNLPTLLMLLSLTAISRVSGELGRVRLGTQFIYKVITLLHKNLLRYILRYPGIRALPESPGEAISRLRGDAFRLPATSLGFGDLLTNFLLVTVALIIMFRINFTITLVTVFPLLAIIAISKWATVYIETYQRQVRQASGLITGFISESFGSIQAIKVAQSEDKVLARFAALNEERRQAILKDRLFNEVLKSIFQNSVNLGIGFLLLLSARSLQTGEFTVGDLALFVYYLDIVTKFIGVIGVAWASYKQTGVAVNRLLGLLPDAPPQTLTQPGPIYQDGNSFDIPQPVLSPQHDFKELAVNGLSFLFPGTDRGIKDINLRLKKGSFTVITGRVGSGKTTLLRVLLGLLPKDTGEIRWNGQIVTDPAAFFIPPRTAYAPQVSHLFSCSLRENLLLGIQEDRTDLERAIYLAVLEQDLKKLEDGLDTIIGVRGVKLSGGQAQRTVMARVFVRNPGLLVFDDISNALDVETEQILWQRLFLSGERKGEQTIGKPTCLVVSHRQPVLSRADHIIVLREGAVVAEGKFDYLMATCDEMKQLQREFD